MVFHLMILLNSPLLIFLTFEPLHVIVLYYLLPFLGTKGPKHVGKAHFLFLLLICGDMRLVYELL